MRIVLTGGCTGGHIYPALAIGDKFREKDPDGEVIYIAKGEELERQIIPAHGYKLYEVDSTWFDRSNPLRLLTTIKRTLGGRRDAIKIMKKFRPDAVISTGSFVSVPVVLAAERLNVPVYLHEQNGFPGISNRVAAKKARKVFLGFESAREYFPDQDKVIYSGNPVRSDFSGRDRWEDRESLGIAQDDFVILIFGGSLGSETTNSIGRAVAEEYSGKEGYTVIWGTGKDYYDEIKKRFEDKGYFSPNIRISAYINDMPAQLSACDLTISRSGALSAAEVTMAGRAAIFVPSPNVTADHQYYNARAVADAGGALIVRESGETAANVLAKVRALDSDRDRLRAMGGAAFAIAPVRATDIIYETVMKTYR